MTVVFVGPTSAGKSTLVNSYFGRIVCPSAATPTSFLPVVFTANPGIELFQVMPRGQGLSECLGLNGILESLTCDEAHELIEDCSKTLRQLILSGALCPEEEPYFETWRMEVMVPGAVKCFSIVDCPGGSEGGALGKAVHRLLRYQAQEACLNLLVPRC